MKLKRKVLFAFVFLSVAFLFVNYNNLKLSVDFYENKALFGKPSRAESDVNMSTNVLTPPKDKTLFGTTPKAVDTNARVERKNTVPPKIDVDRLPKNSMTDVIDILKNDLNKKLALPAVKLREVPDYCAKPASRGNSCDGQCQRLTIDKNPRTRISQLLEPTHLQMTSRDHQVLDEMTQQVKGHYDIVIATAASDNHFLESQGLIKNLHEEVFPILKNFTLVYYNLGLNSSNRAKLEKYCKCQVVDFPFWKFPQFFEKLSCYTWKPMIIKAHIKQSKILIWADASVRFNKGPEVFRQIMKETLQRGLQFFYTLGSDMASRTTPTTFHFFGEEPCAYIGRGEIHATFGFYARSVLVERLLLEPWVACALDRRCMCPRPHPQSNPKKSLQMMDMWKRGNGSITYGLAHRFDQSVLNIILMKIYRERYVDLKLDASKVSVSRGDKIHYFP